MVEILAGHRAGREGQCLTIEEDSCQELASGVMQRISIVGISMEVQLKELVGTVLEVWLSLKSHHLEGAVFLNVLGNGSGGASTSGQASACAGEERPSLFSDSGNRLPIFNPFAAAMATLGPAERYESQYMGANEFLNRRLNEEFQKAFEAGIPSSAIYPSPEIYHIGTPSDRTTSEGFRSALSHGTSSVPSHPTSSPVSFGPSTPVQSASAAPAGLQSSPGGMSDVGSTLTPPGLPLRDPPRMAGSYGVSLNGPVFRISSGSIPCENPGHRPIPAQAPIPPPPPQQRVGDPVATVACGAGCNEPSFDSNGTGDES